jgi:ribose-phosphate pyrophosphokinase
MTTMALTSARLRRLFTRLDFAPRPNEPRLASALEVWNELRLRRFAPQAPLSSLVPLGSGAALFVRSDRERDYILERTTPEFADLLGGLTEGAAISSSSKKRQAVRLRRLFDQVEEVGEPVLASYTNEGHGEAATTVDIFAGPIAASDNTVIGAIAACQIRRKVVAATKLAPPATEEDGPVLFALGGSDALAADVARRLGVRVTAHEERDFEDGEHKIRPLSSVRNRDVYVLAGLTSSLGQSVNDKLCRLFFFIGALKQSAARQITLVAPYLCSSRKERQTKPRDPVATRYLAQLLEAVGVDCVVTVAVHNLAAFQNAFRCRCEHLDAQALFTQALAERLSRRSVAVVSPDPGGEKRAELFRQRLERALATPVSKAILDKVRSLGVVTGDLFAGDGRANRDCVRRYDHHRWNDDARREDLSRPGRQRSACRCNAWAFYRRGQGCPDFRVH